MSGNELPRRFYKETSVRAEGDGFGVTLDQRALKTPGGALFLAPTRALAEAIAAEWDAQAERIDARAMPLTQLAFAAIDATPGRREELAQFVCKYAETDLVCHRADAPAALVARQAAAWDPIVAWGSQRFHFTWPVVSGIIAAEISPHQRTVVSREVDDLDAFRCTALAQAVQLAGSALIGFALLESELTAEAAFAAAALDDLWSLENWGEDAEARARLDRLRSDFETLSRFVAALSA